MASLCCLLTIYLVLYCCAGDSSDSDDMAKTSPASRLKHLQQRKRRRPVSAKLLLQGAKEHEEIMYANLKMHNDMWDMHRERMAMQEERWKVESEESRAFQISMDRTLDIMASLAETLRALSAPLQTPTPSTTPAQLIPPSFHNLQSNPPQTHVCVQGVGGGESMAFVQTSVVQGVEQQPGGSSVGSIKTTGSHTADMPLVATTHATGMVCDPLPTTTVVSRQTAKSVQGTSAKHASTPGDQRTDEPIVVRGRRIAKREVYPPEEWE